MRLLPIILPAFLLVSSAPAYEVSPHARKVAEQVVSLFENGTLTPQYCYIEDIHDGRGYTLGKVGFTTGAGDLIDLAQAYLRIHPDARWKTLLRALIRQEKNHSSTFDGIENFPKLWLETCGTKDFIKAQDEAEWILYGKPALKWMKKTGVKSTLAYVIFYDSLVQHGEGVDPDGFPAIVKKVGDKGHRNENEFLASFLNERERVLCSPADTKTQAVWAESVTRVHVLRDLLNSQSLDLPTPFTVKFDTDAIEIRDETLAPLSLEFKH